MTHVLFVLDYFPPQKGWVEQLFGDVSQYLSESGRQVSVLTSHTDPRLHTIDKYQDVTVYRVGSSRASFMWKSLWFALTHKSLIARVDHIHTSTYAAALSAKVIARVARKDITITIHELYGSLRKHLKWSKALRYRLYEWLILKLSRDSIVTPSQASADMIRKLYPRQAARQTLTVIPNQLKVQDWSRDSITHQEQKQLASTYDIHPHDKLLLFVGRLGRDKWLPYVIEAYADLAREFPDSKLVIIAPRTTYAARKSLKKDILRTQAHISSNFLDRQVLWIDPVSQAELKAWMSISHRGLVPSISEWFGYTALEMQTLWLPVIASRIWALEEILHPEGVVFVPYGIVKDRQETLRQALEQNPPSRDIRPSPFVYEEIDYSDYQAIMTSKTNNPPPLEQKKSP